MSASSEYFNASITADSRRERKEGRKEKCEREKEKGSEGKKV